MFELISPRTSYPLRRQRAGTHGRSRAWFFIASLIALAGGPGPGGRLGNEAGAQGRPAAEDDGKALRDTLADWGKRRWADGWPLSNVGDPALKTVVFLYDASISAQASLAEGDAESARRLLARVGRDWPREHGLWVDSLDLATGEAFDRVKGVSRSTNGPNMHLALSSLTVWAATGKRDDDLRKIALTVARSVREQVLTGNGGASPTAPVGSSSPTACRTNGCSIRNIRSTPTPS